MQEAYKDRGFTVLWVLVWDDESPEMIEGFAKRQKISYPILVKGGSAGADWGVRWLPDNYLLDREGEVAARFSEISEKQLPQVRKRIEKLLSEPLPE